MENKEEPLNKAKKGNLSKKKGDHRNKKISSKIRLYIIISFAVFALIFCILGYFIYKNLRNLSELKDVLETRKKELEEGDKTRIELLEKIDSVEKQIELKKNMLKKKKK